MKGHVIYNNKGNTYLNNDNQVVKFGGGFLKVFEHKYDAKMYYMKYIESPLNKGYVSFRKVEIEINLK